MAESMKRLALTIAAATLLAAPAFAPAFAQGQIDTIDRGEYVCELPGNAAGEAGIEQPQENFRIASASRYVTPEGSGTYLRRGDVLTMTSGPRHGDSYAVISRTFLRKIENGEPGRLRCVRQGR